MLQCHGLGIAGKRAMNWAGLQTSSTSILGTGKVLLRSGGNSDQQKRNMDAKGQDFLLMSAHAIEKNQQAA